MEKLLKPKRFEDEPSSATSKKAWLHRRPGFANFIASVRDLDDPATDTCQSILRLNSSRLLLESLHIIIAFELFTNKEDTDILVAMSEIIEFYRGKNILITGAAGFLGKLLIEKLLRVCEVGRIYIIIRDKHGLKAEERRDSIFNVPVFDRLRQLKPNFLNSVQIVRGDVGLPGLGLSEEVTAMLVEKIEVVIHGAATVKFNEPITRAAAINVRGTKEMALLCQKMRNLKVLIHVSTAFSNCLNDEIFERFYDPPVTADELIELCDSPNDRDTSVAVEKLLKKWPNTYVFTKCVAEDAMKRYAKGIPACIIRPAVIIGTQREPIAGWIDNYYGPSGIVSGVGGGYIRVTRVDDGASTDYVPADMCVNVIISAGKRIGKSGVDGEIKIFNFASSPQNKLPYRKFLEYFLEAFDSVPSDHAVWYPSMTMTKSRLFYSILSFVYHFLPAIFVDLMQLISLKKPKAIKACMKTEKFIDAISHFACNSWTFSNDNLIALQKGMSPTDKVLFNFDMAEIDWKEMVNIKVRGVRKYLFQEHEESVPSARKRRFWLWAIDRTLHAIPIILLSMYIAKLRF